MFLGLANDKLNQIDDSEKAYLAATRIKDKDRTAWQGLVNLYDRQSNGVDFAAYRAAVVSLGLIFAERYGLSTLNATFAMLSIRTLLMWLIVTRKNDARTW